MKFTSVVMRQWLVYVFAASMFAVSCNPAGSGDTPGPQSVATITEADEVIAVIGDSEVTLGDLFDQIGGQLGLMDFQYRSQRHQVIETAMKQFVRTKLLESEAQSRGITVDVLVAEVLGDKVSVSDDDVNFFYMQNQAQLGGRSFESLAPQIRAYLENEIRDSVLEEFAQGLVEDHDVNYVLGRPPDFLEQRVLESIRIEQITQHVLDLITGVEVDAC